MEGEMCVLVGQVMGEICIRRGTVSLSLEPLEVISLETWGFSLELL